MRQFDHLFNLHSGGSCIIIGNGPSLKDVPDAFLESAPTLGSNRVYLKYVPNYYACVNPLVIHQYRNEIKACHSHAKFISEGFGFESDYELHSVQTPMFSFCPYKWIHEGYTVTFVLLQLAFWMGFTSVVMVGIDHRYEYEGAPNQEKVMKGDDPNHFDPNYFKGATWNNPDLERSRRAYKMANDVYEANGRHIVNLTPNTGLDVFEQRDMLWAR